MSIGRMPRTCRTCGETFFVHPSRIKQGAAVNCSVACRWSRESKPIEQQLSEKADRSGGPNACWEWTGKRDRDGYGLLWFNRQRSRAHRAAWEVSRGTPVPDGLLVRHLCPNGGNPWCCNPVHLDVGTEKDNKADAVKAGRIPRGERNHNSRLTEDRVREILTRDARGESRQSIATAIGVSISCVTHVIARRAWKHVSFDAPSSEVRP